MIGLLCYCRAGFEPELAAELTQRAADAGIAGYARTDRDSGFACFMTDDAEALSRALPWRGLIFARQKLALLADLRDLPASDRIAPMLEVLGATRSRYGTLWVEHPDSDAGKPLAGLARSFSNALRPRLREAGVLSRTDDDTLPRLHVFFVAGDRALLARGDPHDASPWALGIPRLRLHADAPSRSALKLDEAFMTLLDERERARLLVAGMRAADLGAAPGGWTWVLLRHGVHVQAIDNGPLRQHVIDSGLVEHVRADGFHWQPQAPLDWMVCDMVEQPRRVAARMATWLRDGWCQHTIFNLKLPMKKRWDETALCLDLLRQEADRPLRIRARQLFHDREEVTVFASVQSR